MKIRALKFLVCPACRSELDLRESRREGDEIVEGELACAPCGRAYPVHGGVPRFVDAGAYASSFGFQWNAFRTVQLDSRNGTTQSERTLDTTIGWRAEAYRGRLALDAGVGAGRFAEVVAGRGGEVFGVDLTSAVDAAYENIGRRESVHLAQADIFALPFKDGTFDLGYSIGVLHHTPDPAAAFRRLAAAVKHGGRMAVYLYPGYGPGRRGPDLIRAITTRLPLKVMVALSPVSVPLYYLY